MEQKTSISLRDFVTQGTFGNVTMGMKMNEVVAILGKTEIINACNSETISISYGFYEFFFDTSSNALKAIQNDQLICPASDFEWIAFENEKIRMDTWFLKPNVYLTRKEIKAILNAEKIPYTEEMLLDSTIIRFESEVFFDFDSATNLLPVNDAAEVLNGIRFFPEH